MKKLVAAGLLALGVVVAAAGPAAADTYAGRWFTTERECDVAALWSGTQGHDAYCWQDGSGYWELWWRS